MTTFTVEVAPDLLANNASSRRYSTYAICETPELAAWSKRGQDGRMSFEHLVCAHCGFLYRVIPAEEALELIEAFGDPGITLRDFYKCRACSCDVSTFEPYCVPRNPLAVTLPPIIRH